MYSNHIVPVLPWSGTLSYTGCVEPRPRIGKVNQVYFGWVWSGRGIISAKSVGKIGNSIQSDRDQRIHHIYQVNHIGLL